MKVKDFIKLDKIIRNKILSQTTTNTFTVSDWDNKDIEILFGDKE